MLCLAVSCCSGVAFGALGRGGPASPGRLIAEHGATQKDLFTRRLLLLRIS